MQKTQSLEGHGGGPAWAEALRVALRKSQARFCSSVAMNRSLVQEERLRLAFPSMPIRSAAAAREAETRNGIPKLDSAWMGIPAQQAKEGGGAHLEHLVRACCTACTMAGRGVSLHQI